MDATNDTSSAPTAPTRHRHRRRHIRLPHIHRRHRQHRSQEQASPQTTASQEPMTSTQTYPQPIVEQFDANTAYPNEAYGFSVENKMGMPPPYDQATSNPAPPPSYFGGSPPPPPGLNVPTAPPRTQVITSQPVTHRVHPPKLGPGPTGATCATCNKQVVTSVEYVPNNRTHIVSAALCILAGCCCGCFVPYCMRSCKTANHYCPQCKAFIGSYQPS